MNDPAAALPATGEVEGSNDGERCGHRSGDVTREAR